MKQETTPAQENKKALWESELQSLKTAVVSLNLEGYEVRPNHNGFRNKTTYFLSDEKGTSITGSWNYTELNHFILGYGKACKKLKQQHEAIPPAQTDNRELFTLEKLEKFLDDLAREKLKTDEEYDSCQGLWWQDKIRFLIGY